MDYRPCRDFLCDTIFLLLLGGRFAFALAAQVDAAGVNQHTHGLQLLLVGGLELFRAAGIELPTRIIYHVFDTHAGENGVEFEQAGFGIAAHDAQVANHDQLAAAYQAVVPARLVFLARAARPCYAGKVFDMLRETARLLHHRHQHFVGEGCYIVRAATAREAYLRPLARLGDSSRPVAAYDG